MPKTTGSAGRPHKPPQLVVPAFDAQRQVQRRIDAGNALLNEQVTEVLAFQDLEARVIKWETVTYDLLIRIVDSRDYGDSFVFARRRNNNYPQGTMLHIRLANLTASLQSQVNNLEGVVEKIDTMIALPAPIDIEGLPEGPRNAPVHLHMGDVYGTVLVESLANSIESNVKIGLDGAEVAEAFKVMTEALRTDAELDESTRKEALQYLDYLSEASATPPPQRRPALIAAAVTWISGALTVATKAGQVWQEFGPTIEHGLRTIGH